MIEVVVVTGVIGWILAGWGWVAKHARQKGRLQVLVDEEEGVLKLYPLGNAKQLKKIVEKVNNKE